MGKTLISAANSQLASGIQWSAGTASTSWFLGIGGGFNSANQSTTNENRFQMKMPASGVLRKLSAHIFTNTRTTNTTIRTRINGVTGNGIITYGSGVTGRQTDNSNSDTIVAGDLVNVIITTSTAAGVFVPTMIQIEWETTGGATTVFTYNFNHGVALAAAQVDVFPVDGLERTIIWGSPSDDYRASRCYIGAAGTISNLRAFVITQSMNINPTIELYKNGVATGITLSLTGTGAFEDTTHSISVAVGDYIQFKVTTTGRASGSLALASVTTKFTSNDEKTPMFSSLQMNFDPTSVGYNTGTRFGGVNSSRTASATEADHDMLASFAMTISRLQTGWINSSGSNETLTLRVNNADTAVTVTMASGISAATNTVDATHTVSVAANSTFSTKAVTLAATSGPYLLSIVLDSSVGESGVGLLGFSGISFNGVSVHYATGVGILSFSGVSFAGTSTHGVHATGIMNFAGVSFVGGASHSETGTGVLNFSGVNFNGIATRVAVTAVGVLSFAGVTFHSGGFIPTPAGTGLRQFWTT